MKPKRKIVVDLHQRIIRQQILNDSSKPPATDEDRQHAEYEMKPEVSAP